MAIKNRSTFLKQAARGIVAGGVKFGPTDTPENELADAMLDTNAASDSGLDGHPQVTTARRSRQ